jgi:alkyldihydroxyacetonephosphate synthase
MSEKQKDTKSREDNLQLYFEFNPNLNYARENLRWNGWGSISEDFPGANHLPEILNFLREELDQTDQFFHPSVPMEEIKLPKSKITPRELGSFKKILGSKNILDSRLERILHSCGRSYYDVIRLHLNLLEDFVDLVLYPENEKQVLGILEFCEKAKITVIPFGGGSSVVGGLEALKGKGSSKCISLDLTKMNKLIAVNPTNGTASFEAGIYGPHLEKLLNRQGYTLGHFPQSFVYSTLGGWVATRSAGQQSNRYGKIEEMVVSCRMATPKGILSTGDYPNSAAGPEWKEIIAGSEGLLGVITQVTVQIHRLPEKRLYFGILFPDFQSGAEFVRTVNQSEISTAMIRLSDEEETRLFGILGKLGKKGIFPWIKNKIENWVLKSKGLADKKCACIIGLEGSESDTYERYLQIRNLAEENKGFYVGEKLGTNWIKNRFMMPFLRNHIIEFGFGVDTMETSAPFDKLEEIRSEFHTRVKKKLGKALSLCHISHSYQTGASLYFTVLFPMNPKKAIRDWIGLKKMVSDLFLEKGAAASHHHGIGTDHKFWFEKEMGKIKIDALKSMKSSLDKNGILNPKKLFHS